MGICLSFDCGDCGDCSVNPCCLALSACCLVPCLCPNACGQQDPTPQQTIIVQHQPTVVNDPGYYPPPPGPQEYPYPPQPYPPQPYPPQPYPQYPGYPQPR